MVNLGDVSILPRPIILERIREDGFETVMAPGVTSFSAVAARLGWSLTEMETPLHIIPASADLDRALQLPGTKVLMKSGSAIHETVQALERAGLLDRAALVADCGLPSERVFRDLREIPENVSYFATTIPFSLTTTCCATCSRKTAAAASLPSSRAVMGYYDGLGLTSTRASTFELAQKTRKSVVLVVNARAQPCRSLPRSRALQFRPESGIQGVILNGCTADELRRAGCRA